jgi:hypothetical protein
MSREQMKGKGKTESKEMKEERRNTPENMMQIKTKSKYWLCYNLA